MTQHSAVITNSPASFDPSFLLKLPDVEISWQEPLAGHTTFRVGGPVAGLVRPFTEKGLVALMSEIRERAIPSVILGGGSNVLAPDEPWNVLAIQLSLCCSSILRCDEGPGGRIHVYAGAGVRTAQWLGHCLRNGFGGMEFLVGIPGTVGGALIMNAGAANGCMGDTLLWVDLIDGGGERRRLHKSELSVSYRSMGLPADWIVLGACFELTLSPDRSMRAKLAEIMRQRRRTQPLGYPSAGCVFKNPPGVPAGALIERSGLKGFRIGDAEVSEKHANWIINRGNARSHDILSLIEMIEVRVFEDSGVRLDREIRVLKA